MNHLYIMLIYVGITGSNECIVTSLRVPATRPQADIEFGGHDDSVRNQVIPWGGSSVCAQ